MRTLRFHGTTPDRETYVAVGYNSRLDELQAAVLRVLLPHLPEWAAARRAAGAAYEATGLGELATLPRATDGAEPAWHVYVVRHPRADELLEALRAAGIGARPYYRVPIHRQPAMRAWGEGAELPATDEVAATHLALPMGATLSADAVAEVVAAVRHARLG